MVAMMSEKMKEASKAKEHKHCQTYISGKTLFPIAVIVLFTNKNFETNSRDNFFNGSHEITCVTKIVQLKIR